MREESFNNTMSYKEFNKLPKEEKKNILKVRTKEELTNDFIDYICYNNLQVIINNKEIYTCLNSPNGAIKYFRYGKHPKQAKTYEDLNIITLQVCGTSL